MAARLCLLRTLSKRTPLSTCLLPSPSPSPLLFPTSSLSSPLSLSYSTEAPEEGKRRTWVKPPQPIIVEPPVQFPPLDGEEECPAYLREIGDGIMGLNMKELDEFCIYLFEKDDQMDDDEADKIFKSLGAGTSAGPMMVAQPGAMADEAEAEPEEPKAEKTIFKLQLTSIDDFDKNKLKVIKAIRTIKPGEPLDKSKSYVTSLPSIILDEVPKEDALKHQEELAKVGAKIELV